MKKLIKISDRHYIAVDDSEIKEGDWIYYTKAKGYCKTTVSGNGLKQENIPAMKITHSTQPLECNKIQSENANIQKVSWGNIKPLSLSEVEEVINGYSVEKMAESKYPYKLSSNARKKGFIEGFKTHQELAKDKLFTIEDMRKAYDEGLLKYCTKNENGFSWEEFIQSLLPKTEWDIEFDEQGKIKLS